MIRLRLLALLLSTQYCLPFALAYEPEAPLKKEFSFSVKVIQLNLSVSAELIATLKKGDLTSQVIESSREAARVNYCLGRYLEKLKAKQEFRAEELEKLAGVVGHFRQVRGVPKDLASALETGLTVQELKKDPAKGKTIASGLIEYQWEGLKHLERGKALLIEYLYGEIAQSYKRHHGVEVYHDLSLEKFSAHWNWLAGFNASDSAEARKRMEEENPNSFPLQRISDVNWARFHRGVRDLLDRELVARGALRLVHEVMSTRFEN